MVNRFRFSAMATASNDESRYGQVCQTVRLLRLLQRGRQTRQQIAMTMGCGERTIRRMINALRKEGLDVGQVAREDSAELLYWLRGGI